jgi:ABC-type nitrate/sulfonate/bicarbonate transport system ATPase subunit
MNLIWVMPAKGVDVPQGHDIRVEGARLSLGDDPAIDVLGGVDLLAGAGEVTAIVGPSGCGKSTLLDAIAGLVPLDSGRVEAGGDVALMPQRDALMPWLTLAENVALGARLAGMPADPARIAARDAIARLGLEGFARHYPHALSGGMRQRGALARTLLSGRSTWLLDEPFGALDALTRAEMHDVLRHLHHEARPTILLVTHDIAEAVGLATRVLVAGPRPMRIVAEVVVDRSDVRAAADDVLEALRRAGAVA